MTSFMKCRHFYLEIQLREIAHIELHFNHSCIHLFTNSTYQGIYCLILVIYSFLLLPIYFLSCTNDLKLKNMFFLIQRNRVS